MHIRVRLGRASLLLVATAASALLTGLAVVSCSGDDSGASADASVDQTADQTTDAIVASDSGPRDAASDISLDGSMSDSMVDAGIDVPDLQGFNVALSETFCKRLNVCCLSPASAWDQASCVKLFSNPAYGGVLGVGFSAVAYDGGHIAYDKSLAAQCLSQVGGVSCGLVSTTQLNALQALCLSAVAGTLDAGSSGCQTSYECVPGTFCAKPADGGVGTCSVLLPEGGSCTGQDECSYLTNGPPPLYCDPATNTCSQRLPVDAGCTSNSACSTNHCVYENGSAQCTDKGVVSNPGVPNGICDFFTIKDAGGDGD